MITKIFNGFSRPPGHTAHRERPICCGSAIDDGQPQISTPTLLLLQLPLLTRDNFFDKFLWLRLFSRWFDRLLRPVEILLGPILTSAVLSMLFCDVSIFMFWIPWFWSWEEFWRTCKRKISYFIEVFLQYFRISE